MGRKQARGASRKPSPETGELRIIGGQWRSRKLQFPAAGGVRPTPARTRETLFNWLATQLPGARCLDLFAGSGALGLEALSRGAGQAIFVDHTPALTRALKENLGALQCSDAEVVTASVTGYLQSAPPGPFDIVFMDPPFRQDWLPVLFEQLQAQPWLKAGSWVYVEHESELAEVEAPQNWSLHRQKQAGQVSYRLYRVI